MPRPGLEPRFPGCAASILSIILHTRYCARHSHATAGSKFCALAQCAAPALAWSLRLPTLPFLTGCHPWQPPLAIGQTGWRMPSSLPQAPDGSPKEHTGCFLGTVPRVKPVRTRRRGPRRSGGPQRPRPPCGTQCRDKTRVHHNNPPPRSGGVGDFVSTHHSHRMSGLVASFGTNRARDCHGRNVTQMGRSRGGEGNSSLHSPSSTLPS